jgi:hypothetical protein
MLQRNHKQEILFRKGYHDRTAKKGQLGKENQGRTTRKGQSEMDSQDRTARKDSQDGTGTIEQQEQDSQRRTARRELQGRSAKIECQDRTASTGQPASKGQPGEECQSRTGQSGEKKIGTPLLGFCKNANILSKLHC